MLQRKKTPARSVLRYLVCMHAFYCRDGVITCKTCKPCLQNATASGNSWSFLWISVSKIYPGTFVYVRLVDPTHSTLRQHCETYRDD